MTPSGQERAALTKIPVNAVLTPVVQSVQVNLFVKKMNWNFRILLCCVKYSHDNGALLTPDALGGVFCLHIS